MGISNPGSSSTSINTPVTLQNLGLLVSVATNAMTIALKQSDGATDPALGSGAVVMGFHGTTASLGSYSLVSSTAATSIVIPSGASLGQTSAANQYVWVYAINNAGTIELAVSGIDPFGDNTIVSTTAITSGATSGTVMYSTTARTNVVARLIGRLLVNETTAGTWAANTTEVVTAPTPKQNTSNFVPYTPAFVGLGTVAPVIRSRRIGDSLRIWGLFGIGTPTATLASMTVGFNGASANVTVDTAKVPATSLVGLAYQNASAATYFANTILAPASNATTLNFGQVGSLTAGTVAQNGSTLWGTGVSVIIECEVPIVGWSAYGP